MKVLNRVFGIGQIVGIFALLLIMLKSYDCLAENEHRGNYIIDHVKDSYSWHICTINNNDFVIHLPVILISKKRGVEIFSSKRIEKFFSSVKYRGYSIDDFGKIKNEDPSVIFFDISITKTVASLLFCSTILIIFLISVANRIKNRGDKAPKGIEILIYMLVSFVREGIVMQNVNMKYAEKFVPYMLSLFFFIFANNLLGLFPGAANVTGNISIAFSLSVFTFFITILNGKKHFWQHILVAPGIPIWLVPVMFPIEVMGLFTKPLSLTVRLFANIVAGHIVLLSIINLIFIIGSPYIGLISVPLGAFMYIIKLLVCFLQAYVFTMLSSIYLGDAVADSHC